MTTHSVSSGVCYLEILDTARVSVTGSVDPTTDIPYLFMANAVYRVQDTPANNRTCYIQSKDFDMSDQEPRFQNINKTVERVQLEYVDEDADTPVAISISTNGGQTWAATTSRSLGTGTGLSAIADFWFLPVTGKIIRIKIESTSSSKKFTWTGAYVHYYTSGPYLEIS